MRISDWSSDVCSSDLHDIDEHLEQRANIAARQIGTTFAFLHQQGQLLEREFGGIGMDGGDRAGMAGIDVAQIEKGRSIAQFLEQDAVRAHPERALEQMLGRDIGGALRSEEHTSELQSLMRNSYAVLCLKKKKKT